MANDETTIRRMFDEIINQRRFDLIDELVAPDFVEHGFAGDLVGREGFRELLRTWTAAIPDMRCEVLNVAIQGDQAGWLVRMTGTNTGELMGMPPTGKAVDVLATNFGRMRDGQALEHWTGNDTLQLLAQLGVMALPGVPAHA
jgi:predicted ester cyclase